MKQQALMPSEIWFWQLIISPHMAELATELARQGCQVIVVASQAMSSERSSQGWSVPILPGVLIKWADSNEAVQQLVESAPLNSIHLCQGVRANGRVSLAQHALEKRGLQQWVVMETVEDSGWRGLLKRLIYKRIFRSRKKTLRGVLAIGHRTVDWVVDRGMPANRVFPFAYFLPDVSSFKKNMDSASNVFRFIFVGRLIPLKRVDVLINVLGKLESQEFEVWFVGAGPEEVALKELADRKLGGRVRWLGQLPIAEVPSVVAQTDCLILPSIHDGWGAVCSEALMVGTPVICSDACGASGVVRASGVGGVFPRDDEETLRRLLAKNLSTGVVNEEQRRAIADWARALGATAGAAYLIDILRGDLPPSPPWQRKEGAHNQATLIL